MRWTGMVCDLINENSIVTYHAILVMNMYIQSHTLTHKQHKTLRKKLMWYRQMKFFLNRYSIVLKTYIWYGYFGNVKRIVDTSYR